MKMNKRDKLKQELADKEKYLFELENSKPCNCACHTVDGMMHFVPCCSWTYVTEEKFNALKEQVNVLKKKLRLI